MFVVNLRFLSGSSITLTYGSDVPDKSLAASSEALTMRKLSVSVCNDTSHTRHIIHAVTTRQTVKRMNECLCYVMSRPKYETKACYAVSSAEEENCVLRLVHPFVMRMPNSRIPKKVFFG